MNKKRTMAAGLMRVEGLFDITYETLLGFRPLKLDLYRQPGAQTARPAVIFLHGGGFADGSPRMVSPVFGEMNQVLARLAARGYAVVGATYRFSSEVHFPQGQTILDPVFHFLDTTFGT